MSMPVVNVWHVSVVVDQRRVFVRVGVRLTCRILRTMMMLVMLERKIRSRKECDPPWLVDADGQRRIHPHCL